MSRALLIAALLAACGRDRFVEAPQPLAPWAFPLVGPLENGALFTPVYVEGHGPYLFVVDSSADMSTFSERVIREAGLHESKPDIAIRHLRVGDVPLEVPQPFLYAMAPTVSARPVDGVLGADAITQNAVVAIDRDAGMMYVTPPLHFAPPAGTQQFPIESHPTKLANRPAFTVQASIGGRAARLGFHPMAERSSIRAAWWAPVIRDVRVGGVHVDALPVERNRDPDPDLGADPDTVEDGSLAIDFFQGSRFWIDYARDIVYVAPRQDVSVGKRLARWGVAGVRAIGVTARVDVDEDGDTILTVTRPADDDASAALEVLLVPTSGDSRVVGPVVATLPAGVPSVTVTVDPGTRGAHFVVADASPFPRACEHAGRGCVSAFRAAAGP